MASLSDIVPISISVSAAPVKGGSFSMPAIIGCSNRFSEVGRYYNDLSAMVSDGFLATDPEYLAAQAVWSQTPSAPKILVARRSLVSTPVCTLTPVAANSTVYRVFVQNTLASYTSDSSATVAEICTGLKSAIDALALSGVTVTNNTTYLSIAVTAGKYLRIKVDGTAGYCGFDKLLVDWTHADPGIATDLGNLAAYAQDWYGLILAGSMSPAEVAAAAVWANANGKLMLHASNQSAIITTAAPGSDIVGVAHTANYSRVAVGFKADNGEFADAALMSNRFTFSPGSESWMFCSLDSVSADNLSSTHLQNIRNKNGFYFASFGGVTISSEGKVASGEYIDVTRGVDGLRSDIQSSVYAALLKATANGKMPYTDVGAVALKAAILGALDRYERNGFLVTKSSVVTIPSVASQSAADRAARKFAGITFSALLADAVHAVSISGTVVR